MEVSSKHQLMVFLLCILSGIFCALFFDLQRSLRRIHSAGKIRTTAEDILFAVVVTFVLIGLGFYFNRGQMRYYQVAGALSGALFYVAFLSRISMKIIEEICRIIKYSIRPIMILIRIISSPILWIYRLIKALLLKIKRAKTRILCYGKKKFLKLKKRMKML